MAKADALFVARYFSVRLHWAELTRWAVSLTKVAKARDNFGRQISFRLGKRAAKMPDADDQDLYRGKFVFHYIPMREHLWNLLKMKLWRICLLSFAILGVVWTYSEAYIQFFDAKPRGWIPYLFLVFGSLLISAIWNGYQYFHHIIDGFENVSPHARQIAHLQRPGWEYHLAKSLLAQKLGPSDRELRDLDEGRDFVMAKNVPDLQDYLEWASARFVNLDEMLAVAKNLLSNEFLPALHGTPNESPAPKRILDAVESLARFYRETVAFERDHRSIIPPEGLGKLHDHQKGWSDPIRNAVLQLFQILQLACDSDPHAESDLSFVIDVCSPPGVDEFSKECARLQCENID